MEKTINADIHLSIEKDPNIDTLKVFLKSEQNLNITSIVSIVPASINKSPSPPNVKATKKQDTSNKYIEKLAYRRTTYTKKYNTLKSKAENLKSKSLSAILVMGKQKNFIPRICC